MLRRGFIKLTPEREALELLLARLPGPRSETLGLEEAQGRVLHDSITAPRDVPHYDRSAMDGFAVRAVDTAPASVAGPVRFTLGLEGGALRAAPVRTGSPIPPWADAVVPVEDVERDGTSVDVLCRVREGEHVGQTGEDVHAGEIVLERGRVLRAVDLAVLRALGIERVPVSVRPRVRLVSTGEELLAPGGDPRAGSMIDSNSLMLAAQTRRWGGDPAVEPAYSDDAPVLSAALERVARDSDLVVTCGGTSVGERDQVVEALRAAGEVAFHGVAIQPARPVAAGTLNGVPVLCLPGFPAAAFIAAFAFLRPALVQMSGSTASRLASCRGRLSRKIVSTLGLKSYTRVRVVGDLVEPVRTSGAGLLSSLVRADGFVVTPEDTEGWPEGALVEVLLFD